MACSAVNVEPDTVPLARLRSQLGGVPHSLQLVDVWTVKRSKCLAVLHKLDSEKDQQESVIGTQPKEESVMGTQPKEESVIGTQPKEESVIIDNLISILNFRLGNKDEAFKLNSEVLGHNPKNITALVTKAYMKTLTRFDLEAMDVIKDVLNLIREDDSKLLFATSLVDQANSYSRLAPKYYIKAIDLFEKAIGHFPQNYDWKFGYALTVLRCFKPANGVRCILDDRMEECYVKAMSYLYDASKLPIPNPLKAKVLVVLGEFIQYFEPKYTHWTPKQITYIRLQTQHIKITDIEEQCFIEALKIAPDDYFVLQRCGKQLRYIKKPAWKYKETLEMCLKLLEKSHSIRPTSFNCVTLAHTISKLVENKSGAWKQWNKTQRSLCSPKVVTVYTSENDRYELNRAIEYLKESIGMSYGCDMSAVHNLGMMYRRLGHQEEALSQFRTILSDRESLNQQLRAFEQAAFCLLGISEDHSIDQTRRQDCERESKYMMVMAIQKAAQIVAHIPVLNREDIGDLESFPTLRQILHQQTVPGRKEIAYLCELIRNNKDTLEVLNEFPDDSDTRLLKMKAYMQQGEFNSGLTTLSILLCTSDGRKAMGANEQLVYQMYLGTARNLLMQPAFDLALLKEAFLGAFEYKHKGLARHEDEESLDVLFLDDQSGDTEATSTALRSFLVDICGLSVTHNADDVPGGSLEHSGLEDVIRRSKCVVFVIGQDFASSMELLVNKTIRCDTSGVIVAVLTAEGNLPPCLSDRNWVRARAGDENNIETRLNLFLAILKLDPRKFEWL